MCIAGTVILSLERKRPGRGKPWQPAPSNPVGQAMKLGLQLRVAHRPLQRTDGVLDKYMHLAAFAQSSAAAARSSMRRFGFMVWILVAWS